MNLTKAEQKSLYITNIISIGWKDKHTERPINSVRWVDSTEHFMVQFDTSGIEFPFTWEEFYDKFVETSNKKFWKHTPKTPSSQEHREDAGWLTLIQGFALFDFYATRHVVKTNEVIGVQNYVIDRVEDAHFSIVNSMSLPWATDLQETGIYQQVAK